jgi:hypothetical protein
MASPAPDLDGRLDPGGIERVARPTFNGLLRDPRTLGTTALS